MQYYNIAYKTISIRKGYSILNYAVKIIISLLLLNYVIYRIKAQEIKYKLLHSHF